MVFGVINYKVSGYKGTVEIVPLAAGGTRPIHILYKGKEIDGGEFHSWFEGNHTSATPINVGGYSAKGISRTLEVGTDFTMSCVDGESNMGGFAIRVDKPGEQTSTTINAPDFNAGVLEAPQMICVPQTWQWPSEQTPITDAYRDFTAWCADQTAATDWHTRPEEGMTIGHDFATQLPENVFVLECGSPNETMAYSNGTYYKKFTYTLPEEALKQLNATRTSTLIVYIPLENDMKYHLGSYDSDATFTGRTSTNATEFTIPHDKISYFNTEPLLVVSYMYCRDDFSQNIMIEIN